MHNEGYLFGTVLMMLVAVRILDMLFGQPLLAKLRTNDTVKGTVQLRRFGKVWLWGNQLVFTAFFFYSLYVHFGTALLRHEYGHVLHLSQVGWESYITWVVVPSVAGFLKGTKYGVYFSQPFEYIADMLGGVVRTDGANPYVYADDAQERAEAYWQFTYDYVGVFPYG